jgi:hypothetical protein
MFALFDTLGDYVVIGVVLARVVGVAVVVLGICAGVALWRLR